MTDLFSNIEALRSAHTMRLVTGTMQSQGLVASCVPTFMLSLSSAEF